MTLHLIKLCVGVDSIEELADWQDARRAEQRKAGATARNWHTTFQTPKREADLLDGGSIYWVIKGAVQVRQKLIGFEPGAKSDGSKGCRFILDDLLVPVRPVPRRPFQGWRYLDPADAPPDLGNGDRAFAELPAKMRRELAELCLI
ncbi:MAG: DUF1489 domain-containing protein [Hyphomicrobium sp.]|jgi:hypothetical protein